MWKNTAVIHNILKKKIRVGSSCPAGPNSIGFGSAKPKTLQNGAGFGCAAIPKDIIICIINILNFIINNIKNFIICLINLIIFIIINIFNIKNLFLFLLLILL